jgi:hypothetical protein
VQLIVRESCKIRAGKADVIVHLKLEKVQVKFAT